MMLFPVWPPGGSRSLGPTSVPTMALLQRGPKLAPILPPSPSLWVAESCCLALPTDPNPQGLVTRGVW